MLSRKDSVISGFLMIWEYHQVGVSAIADP